MKSKTKSVQVLVRLTPEEAARLDEVAALQPSLKGRPQAVRRLLDLLADEVQTDRKVLSPEAAQRIRDALAERTRAFNDLAAQARPMGNLLNQIAKVGNQMLLYGRKAVVKETLVEGLRAEIEGLREQVEIIANQDAHIEKILRELS